MKFLALLLAGCGACYDGQYDNVTSYPVHATSHTPKGIAVDGELDLAEIDRRTDAVEACLRARFPDGRLPPELLGPGHCLYDTVELTVPRGCLTVKLAPDWHMSCTGNQQVFPCGVDPSLCVAKGLTPTEACPCECRSAIQDQSTIVVTPNLHLYDGDLIRLQTSCNFIWIPGLVECYEQ